MACTPIYIPYTRSHDMCLPFPVHSTKRLLMRLAHDWSAVFANASALLIFLAYAPFASRVLHSQLLKRVWLGLRLVEIWSLRSCPLTIDECLYHNITHRHPAPRSSPSRPRSEWPLPVPLPPVSSSSRKSAGLTVMCTTLMSSSLNGKSTAYQQ